jgi:hypothetical protein
MGLREVRISSDVVTCLHSSSFISYSDWLKNIFYYHKINEWHLHLCSKYFFIGSFHFGSKMKRTSSLDFCTIMLAVSLSSASS